MPFWMPKTGAKTASAQDQSALERRITEERARTQRQWKRLLVPALDMPYSMRSLEVAFKLAQGADASIKLAYVVEVPRALPINAAMPDSEAAAAQALADAQEAARAYRGVTVEPFVHRTRNAREGILKLIAQENVDLMVLGARPDGLRGLPKDLTRELFARAPCEVVLDYIADEK